MTDCRGTGPADGKTYGVNPLFLRRRAFSDQRVDPFSLVHEELLKAMAYLKHLLRAENPAYQAELAQRHADIEAGRGVSLTEAKQRLEHG